MDIKRRLFLQLSPSFIGILAFIPLISLAYIGYERHQRSFVKFEELQRNVFKAKKLRLLQTDREHFVNQYGKANHFYVEEILEPLPLLVNELKVLQAMGQDELFDQCDLVKRREEKLTANRMNFAENKRNQGKGLIETESHLLSKVEVDGEDLKQILSLIEGVCVGSFPPRKEAPQLIIKRFSLEKKKGIALLDLEMIKRELHEKN